MTNNGHTLDPKTAALIEGIKEHVENRLKTVTPGASRLELPAPQVHNPITVNTEPIAAFLRDFVTNWQPVNQVPVPHVNNEVDMEVVAAAYDRLSEALGAAIRFQAQATEKVAQALDKLTEAQENSAEMHSQLLQLLEAKLSEVASRPIQREVVQVNPTPVQVLPAPVNLPRLKESKARMEVNRNGDDVATTDTTTQYTYEENE